MEYGDPLCECVTALTRQSLKIGPLPGMFQVTLVTRLFGVSAPVGARSDSGSLLFSGENQWFSLSSDFDRV